MEEVRIYQSVWKNMLLSVLCLAFAVGGCYIVRSDDCSAVVKIIGGWLNILFFGGGGLFLIAVTLYNSIRHIPMLMIHADRVDVSKPFRGICRTVDFADVESFRLVKVYSTVQIAIDYNVTGMVNEVEKSSSLRRKMMAYNFDMIGAADTIPVVNLTMKGDEICDILNSRLKSHVMETKS